MKKFEVIQDNGGGIHLAVLNEEGLCDYFHANYDAALYRLLEDVGAILGGDDPAKDWEGNCASCPGILIGADGTEWELGDDPNALYSEYNFMDGTAHIVVDQDGLYPARMNQDVMEAFGFDPDPWDACQSITWEQYFTVGVPAPVTIRIVQSSESPVIEFPGTERPEGRPD